MECSQPGCPKTAEDGSDECFRHRVLGVGFTYSGGARGGRKNWNVSKTEHMIEHLGTADDKELGRRGIELDKHVTTPRYDQ